MKETYEFILWSVAFIVVFNLLINLMDLDDWLKGLIGKKRTNKKLEAKIEALERRVAELEKKP
jgi:hypothetical protein